MTRGIRNNNPANIRHSTSSWKGLCDTQTDAQFCQFDAMVFGIRALIITLRTYVTRRGLYSISEIICRFAPPMENVTKRYILYVLDEFKKEGYQDDVKIVKSDFEKYCVDKVYILCRAICWIESNYKLTKEEFIKALSLT